MTLHQDVVYEVRTGGSDDNGGGFVSSAAGTDYSQQDAAQASGTNLTVDAVDNTKVAPDGHTPVAADVGNLIQITAGASFTLDFYEITAQDGTSWTLDRSPATTGTTGGTWAMGGALGSPGKLTDALQVDYQKAYIKSGTYTLTTTTVGSGGPLYPTSNLAVYIEGYDATRGDLIDKDYFDKDDNFPLIHAGSQSPAYCVRLAGTFNDSRPSAACLSVDGNDNATDCFYAGNSYVGDFYYRCKAIQGSNRGFYRGRVYECYASDNGGVGIHVERGIRCLSENNGGSGYAGYTNQRAMFTHCIAYNNGGNGFNSGVYGTEWINCTSVDNTGDGFSQTNYSGMDGWHSCIAYGNGGYGWDFRLHSEDYHLSRCAGGSNTSGNIDGVTLANIAFITLTADPFVDKANNDFRLNDTAGGGALLRSLGRVANQPNDNGDIGATTHTQSGGGSTGKIARNIFLGERQMLAT